MTFNELPEIKRSAPLKFFIEAMYDSQIQSDINEKLSKTEEDNS